MGLEVISEEQQKLARAEALGRGRFVVVGRWARTFSGQLVPEEQCFEGGELVYRDGDEIPLEEARRVGLLAVETKAEPKPEDKAAAKPRDKSRRKPATKEAN